MKKSLGIGILLLLFRGSSMLGCSVFDKDTAQMNKSAQQLAAEGAAAFMNEDYKDAVKAYTDLKDWYPFSKYAILAELKIADAQFHLEAYDEAIVAYESFERMHPRNEAVPYVINQIGKSWFSQIDTVDRDSTSARNAMAQFQRLVWQYPDSEYVLEAMKKIEACIDTIAGHELYVADFYNKTEEYLAAQKRYEFIVEHYPESKQAKSALEKIPQVSKRAQEAKDTKE